MSQNEQRRPAKDAAANTTSSRKTSAAPRLVIVVEYEGRASAAIRGCRDETDAIPMRAWLESDHDLRRLCQLARTIRDRFAA